MKFKTVMGDKDVPDNLTVMISYGVNGEPVNLEFGLSGFFSRSIRERGTDPFTHINLYLKSLPWSAKKGMVKYYTEAAEIFNTIPFVEEASRQLAILTKDFFTPELISSVTDWMRCNCVVAVPPEFTERFDISDGKAFTAEKTYIRDEYVVLAGFALATRLMLPIWSEFANIHQQAIGESYWGYECAQLLRLSGAFNSPALVKLRDYIVANLESADTYKIVLPSIIADGSGSETHVDLILGTFIVKRLPIHDVTNPELANMVVVLWNDVTGRRQMSVQGSTQFGDGIKMKDPSTKDDGSTDAMSSMETLRVKSEHPMGPIVAHESYLRNYSEVARRLIRDVELNHDLLELLNSTVKNEFGSDRIPEHTIILTKWIMSPIIHPSAISLIQRAVVLDVISVAQYYLIIKGHKELAVLLTCKFNKGSNALQGGGGTLDRLPVELSNKLCELVPHIHITQKRNKTEPMNRGVQSVDMLAKQLISNDWSITLPRDLFKELTGRDGGTRYRTPSSIAVHLANLAIEIGDNTKASISK